jgi:hypothetical protein
LEEVYPLTLEKWEEGFRRDANPEQEIASWLLLARTYQRCIANRDFGLPQKNDLLGLLVNARTNGKEAALLTFNLQALTREEAVEVLELAFTRPSN